jgi:anti-repressor protein
MEIVKAEKTMSSIEIADLTGKKHAHVMRDIRNMFESLGIEDNPFLDSRINGQNKEMPLFNLPREECTILVSGYDITLRAKIVRRWLELESSMVPKSLPEALRLAADQAEKIERLEHQTKEDAPRVEFARVVEGTDAKLSIGAFAKLSGQIGRNNLFKKLRESKILMENNQPYQRYIDSGYFETSESIIKRTNQDMIIVTPYITGKGQLWISNKIEDWV